METHVKGFVNELIEQSVTDERVLTARFEMKCSPEELTEFKTAAHKGEKTLSAFVRDAARAAARESESTENTGLTECFTPEELHVVWVAAAEYLTSVVTGETVIITDPEGNWPRHLGTAVEKLTRAMNRRSSVVKGNRE
jgi:hypothetical protein